MPLKLYDRNGVWWIRGTVAGRRVHASSRTSDKRLAQRLCAEREAAEWKGHLDGPASVLTFMAAATLYRAAGKGDDATAKVRDYWSNTLVNVITPGTIRSHAIKAFPLGSPATRNRQFITPTAAVINHAADLEICDPVRVKRFPVKRKVAAYVDRAWLNAFTPHATPRIAAMAWFMFLTAARVGSTNALRWHDVDLQRAHAIIRDPKGGNDHVCHLPPFLVAEMASLRTGDTSEADLVFGYGDRQGHRKAWNAAIKASGVPRRTAHAMRHGFATCLLRAGYDPKTVMERGDWSDVKLFMETYAHAIEDVTITDRLAPDAPSWHRERTIG